MKGLYRRALIGILRTFFLLLAAIFLPVCTLRYWRGWVCLAAFFIPACGISAYVAKHDPALLERRLRAGPRAEKETGQKIVQGIASVVFLADFVVSALDRRFGRSSVPLYGSFVGVVMMLAGFAITFAVLKANRYASGIIEVAEDQRVVTTGPYAVVRHPMYSGALIMLMGIPPTLGSWWGTLVNLPLAAAIIWRLLDEERFLTGQLAGYGDYKERVRYRLVPFFW